MSSQNTLKDAIKEVRIDRLQKTVFDICSQYEETHRLSAKHFSSQPQHTSRTSAK